MVAAGFSLRFLKKYKLKHAGENRYQIYEGLDEEKNTSSR